MKHIKRAFTLIELLVVIGIIGILSTVAWTYTARVKIKARDAKRKAEIASIGRILTGLACYLPTGGAGEYDLIAVAEDIIASSYENKDFFSNIPIDPLTGSQTESKYMYIVTEDGKDCVLYANLEDIDQKVTLEIEVPTPGGGIGVFQAASSGWNNSPLYFQFSN